MTTSGTNCEVRFLPVLTELLPQCLILRWNTIQLRIPSWFRLDHSSLNAPIADAAKLQCVTKRSRTRDDRRRTEAQEVLIMTMPIQDFVRDVLTPAIQKLSPEEKREFRQVWLSQINEREADRNFLRSCGVDPDGD